MLIRNTKEFLKKTFQKKIICLDIGKVKVGIAISDSNKKISTPLKIIIRDKKFYSNLKDLILEYDIYGILIGLPLNEDLSKNKMCQFITDIAKNIDSYLSRDKKEIPIFFWDESYTSLEAMDTTNNLIKNKKKQKSVLDKYAASVILGDFLREI
tara:strand:+ start:804 stop:1265 length:462 start_codon:yes stop_codon:yes gene_type:complete